MSPAERRNPHLAGDLLSGPSANPVRLESTQSDAVVVASPAGWTRLLGGVARFATRDVSLTSLILFRSVHFPDSVNFESEPARQLSSGLAGFRAVYSLIMVRIPFIFR